MSVGGRKENGRLRHYDGIRRLKATYVIVTGRLATNVVVVACQPGIETAQPPGKICPGRKIRAAKRLLCNGRVLKWITLAEDRLRIRSRWNELRTRSRSLN